MFVLHHAGEPMDSVCQEPDPQQPTKICHPVRHAAIEDIKQEVLKCPTAAEVKKNLVDSPAGSSENSQNDSASVSDGGTAARAPKQGKKVIL